MLKHLHECCCRVNTLFNMLSLYVFASDIVIATCNLIVITVIGKFFVCMLIDQTLIYKV